MLMHMSVCGQKYVLDEDAKEVEVIGNDGVLRIRDEGAPRLPSAPGLPHSH